MLLLEVCKAVRRWRYWRRWLDGWMDGWWGHRSRNTQSERSVWRGEESEQVNRAVEGSDGSVSESCCLATHSIVVATAAVLVTSVRVSVVALPGRLFRSEVEGEADRVAAG